MKNKNNFIALYKEIKHCESTLNCGYQFSWIRLIDWLLGFNISAIYLGEGKYTSLWILEIMVLRFQCESAFCWEPNFVVWFIHENHKNWYPMNNSTFTVSLKYRRIQIPKDSLVLYTDQPFIKNIELVLNSWLLSAILISNITI